VRIALLQCPIPSEIYPIATFIGSNINNLSLLVCQIWQKCIYCDPIDKQYHLMQTTAYISDNGKSNTRVARVYLWQRKPRSGRRPWRGSGMGSSRRQRRTRGRLRWAPPASLPSVTATLPGLLKERRPERVVVLLHRGGRREGEENSCRRWLGHGRGLHGEGGTGTDGRATWTKKLRVRVGWTRVEFAPTSPPYKKNIILYLNLVNTFKFN
jgi:hypothetical protein